MHAPVQVPNPKFVWLCLASACSMEVHSPLRRGCSIEAGRQGPSLILQSIKFHSSRMPLAVTEYVWSGACGPQGFLEQILDF
eukprot:1158730-Pelagomonas_calceolata.AAC.1